ncbi:MAG: binding-protein-dependent transport system inner rane component [Marmoricola sp.]|nr:binding-protein-dependent transport system inner rane component [Marmoricola sp.]
MLAYIVRRLFAGGILLVAMSMITFILFFAIPSDPAQFACGKNCSLAQRAQVRKGLGYDKPVAVQWENFAVGVFKGRDYPDDKSLAKSAPQLIAHCAAPCLGYSRVNLQTVTQEFKQRIPVSASLALAAFLMWIIGGIGLGALAAVWKGTIIDRGVVGISLVFYAFPTFFVGLFLLKYLAIKWQVFPVPSYISIADGGLWNWFVNLILPALTLALFYMAGYVRMTRAFVLESMSEDYLRTAKAKGLAPRKILYKHTMRAALTPLVTMAGLDLAGLLGGAVITESVFNYNGLGKLVVDSVITFDLPTVVGLVLLLGAFVIVANIIVDILYALIDPRVRVG